MLKNELTQSLFLTNRTGLGKTNHQVMESRFQDTQKQITTSLNLNGGPAPKLVAGSSSSQSMAAQRFSAMKMRAVPQNNSGFDQKPSNIYNQTLAKNNVQMKVTTGTLKPSQSVTGHERFKNVHQLYRDDIQNKAMAVSEKTKPPQLEEFMQNIPSSNEPQFQVESALDWNADEEECDPHFPIENFQDEVFAEGIAEKTTVNVLVAYSKFSEKQKFDFVYLQALVQNYLVLYKKNICEEYKIDPYQKGFNEELDEKEIGIMRSSFSLHGFWNQAEACKNSKPIMSYKEDTNFNQFVLNVWNGMLLQVQPIAQY